MHPHTRNDRSQDDKKRHILPSSLPFLSHLWSSALPLFFPTLKNIFSCIFFFFLFLEHWFSSHPVIRSFLLFILYISFLFLMYVLFNLFISFFLCPILPSSEGVSVRGPFMEVKVGGASLSHPHPSVKLESEAERKSNLLHSSNSNVHLVEGSSSHASLLPPGVMENDHRQSLQHRQEHHSQQQRRQGSKKDGRNRRHRKHARRKLQFLSSSSSSSSNPPLQQFPTLDVNFADVEEESSSSVTEGSEGEGEELWRRRLTVSESSSGGSRVRVEEVHDDEDDRQ